MKEIDDDNNVEVLIKKIEAAHESNVFYSLVAKLTLEQYQRLVFYLDFHVKNGVLHDFFCPKLDVANGKKFISMGELNENYYFLKAQSLINLAIFEKNKIEDHIDLRLDCYSKKAIKTKRI